MAIDTVDLIEKKKGYYRDSAKKVTDAFSPMPWTLRQKVALACRILASNGHNSLLAGQISALTDDGQHFWTQRYAIPLDQIRVSSLVRVDHDLKVVEGTGMANPANRFHKWIYAARSDVRSIVHTHARYTSALSIIGEPLVASHMDTVSLFEDVAHLAEWPGVPFGDEEGRIISEALGQRRAILLAHHGLLTVGRNLEEACTRAIVFEKAAEMQILAMSAGKVRKLRSDIGLDGRKFSDSPIYSSAHFEAWSQGILASGMDCLN